MWWWIVFFVLMITAMNTDSQILYAIWGFYFYGTIIIIIVNFIKDCLGHDYIAFDPVGYVNRVKLLSEVTRLIDRVGGFYKILINNKDITIIDRNKKTYKFDFESHGYSNADNNSRIKITKMLRRRCGGVKKITYSSVQNDKYTATGRNADCYAKYGDAYHCDYKVLFESAIYSYSALSDSKISNNIKTNLKEKKTVSRRI